MPFIGRDTQIANRLWDAFSPLRRLAGDQLGLYSLRSPSLLRDELLDGIPITRRDIAAHWINENTVHRAVALSHRIEDTRSFLGAQVVATRDDIRQLSHFIVIEPDSLLLITTSLGEIIEKRTVHAGRVRRAHLCLDIFSGIPHCLYVAQADANKYCLCLNGQEIATSSDDLDFPFMAWSQAAKGHVPMSPTKYGVISYKCRATGKLFVRSIDASGSVAAERELVAPTCIGGADFAIHDDDILFHIDAVADARLVPMTATSSDGGVSISGFKPVDLAGFSPDAIAPSASPIARDHLGNFHVPIAALKDGRQHLLDVHSDHVVEAMVLEGQGYGYNLLVFPKKPDTNISALGRGDGLTDGVGIIATTIAEGRLMISNSQAGGFHYPKERCVNHEMAQMFAFRATECCYTRAQTANMVSMDYIFIESNHDGDPLSNTLWLETWDMPLPMPAISASSNGSTVRIKIEKDGWFERGKTTFKISDPKVNILAVDIVDGRNAILTCDRSELTGNTVTFDMKNFYYWHSGSTEIK